MIRALGGGAAAFLMSAAPLYAAGIERLNQSVGIIFEPGRVIELGYGYVSPSISGTYSAIPAFGIPAQSTGDIAPSYQTWSLSYKQDFTPNLSAAIIVDTPLGIDTHYPDKPFALLGDTAARVDSTHVTGVLRYRADNGFGVHGGLRMSSADGEVTLAGAVFGAYGLASYNVQLDQAQGWGWLAGVSWEKPEIAARVSLTYNSEIDHDFDAVERVNGGPAAASKTTVTTPRSWNLEAQTGIAKDTLVFGSVRWVKWSEMRLNPVAFRALGIPGTEKGLVEIDDKTTLTLGVGHKFTENWSGLASVSYEADSDKLISPLGGYEGRLGLTLAGVYTRDNMKVTAGVNWTRLGDSKLRPDLSGAAGLGLATAEMTDNHSVGFGIRTQFSF